MPNQAKGLAMRISNIKTFRADGGWRPYSFLKIETDEGCSGWSEFAENSWSPGLVEIIKSIGQHAIGQNPQQYARLSAELHAMGQFVVGGLHHQAVAAIENACIDIAAKSIGVPVHKLFGGSFRDAIDLYWSHCGTFRITHPELFEQILGKPPLRSLQDVRRLAMEVKQGGYKAVKINPIVFEEGQTPTLLNPGFMPQGLSFDRSIDEATLEAITNHVNAMREGLGHYTGLMLDVNFGFRPEALRRISKAVAPAHLTWLEMDVHTSEALAAIRAAQHSPIASLESLYGCRDYLGNLQAQAVDVAIVDVPWNGFNEAVRIANLAETFEVNVAPHNFYGPLADLMSAHFCAAVGNVSIMEFEADDVPWKYDLLTDKPQIENGQFVIPTTAGWGAEINEEILLEHPWKEKE